MTIKVELNPDIEALLKREAHSQGLPLEKVAERLLEQAVSGLSLNRGRMSLEEFHAMLVAIGKGADRLPHLPTESFSRESFYEDRLDDGNAVPRR